MDKFVQETPNCVNQDQILVTQLENEQTLVSQLKNEQTPVFQLENEPILVTQLKNEENPVSQLENEPVLVSQLEFEQALFTQLELEQNPETDLESERGCERGLDDLSSGSSFKSLGVFSDEDLVEEDDVECDRTPLCWYEGRSYTDMRSGELSWPRRWDGNENKKADSSFSWSQPYLGEVNFDMVGAGLSNLGNTCFLNAILQCFTHTVPLVQGLRSYNHPKPCERDSEGFCVFCALHNHIEDAITRKGQSLSPLRIVENLNQLSSGFQRYQQEDAHELLQCLLDKLDMCCNGSGTDGSDGSLVHRLFGGCLVSKLKCCKCGHCSDTFESLIDLSLEIENVNSLEHALESFTKVEKIEDEEPQFTCENCKEKVAVEKQLMVDRAPSIAAFHLKRFKNNGSCVEKIDTHVEFPLELDMKPYTSGGQNDDVDLSYSLYGIVVHSGFSPTSGHYYCFVRSAPDEWYRLDDTKVTKVSEFHVLSRDAYILLYAKNGTPWFSTFMETEKLSMDCIALSSTSPISVLENAKQSSESSPITEANIISEVSEEDRREAAEFYERSFSSSRHKDDNGVAKVSYKTDEKLLLSTFGGDKTVISNTSPKSTIDKTNHISESSTAPKGDNSNQKNGEFSKSADFNSSTSERSISPARVSRLSFDDCTLEDKVQCAKDGSKVEEKLPASALRDEDGKSTDVKSSTISAKPVSILRDYVMAEKELLCKKKSSDDVERKEASKLTSLPLSKRRSQLLSVNSPNSIRDETNQTISESSPVMGTNISCEVDVEDMDDAMEISTLGFDRVGKGADVKSSTNSGLVFSAKPCSIPKSHVMTERELPCKRKLIDDRHSKQACKVLKSVACPRRRTQLLSIVNKNSEACLNNKKTTKVNKPSANMKDVRSNSHHNPNFVSLRRPVATGRI